MTRPVSVTTYAGRRAITNSPADSPCAPSLLAKSDSCDKQGSLKWREAQRTKGTSRDRIEAESKPGGGRIEAESRPRHERRAIEMKAAQAKRSDAK